MDDYYRQLATRDVDSQRSAEDIRAAAVDDLSKPLPRGGGRSCFPNLLSHDREMAVRATLYGADEAAAGGSALDASNVGHRMLRAMGWQEGTGLGKSRQGRLVPVQAVPRKAGVGVGADEAERVKEGDDAFEIYKKTKMAAYKHRPNPLNNPRRAY
jgi:hypothetical protein